MKKILLGLMMIVSVGAKSQEISGRAIYDTKLNIDDMSSKIQLGGELGDEISKALKKAGEKKYVLEFTKNESIYQEDEELVKPMANSGRNMVIMKTNSSGKTYKNLKNKQMLTESDLLDKALLVKEDLEDFGWELTTETKKIGKYTAYKAIKKISYEQVTDVEGSTDILNKVDTKKSKNETITAWYTPEIPVSNGPDKFGGLPGLILELHLPHMVYLCSEIILNPKKPIQIKPLKGKEISAEEYNKIISQRFKGGSSININGEEIKLGR